MEFHSIEEIFVALDQSREKLTAAANAVSGAQADFRSDAGVWSAREIIEHLAKTEDSLTKLIERLLVAAEAANLPPANGKIDPPVSFAAIAAQAAGRKFNAPEAIRPNGAASIAESLRQLEKSRQKLKDLRPRLEQIDLTKTEFPHPAFGKINVYYWLAFIGMHELRHLKQMNELLARQ
jgi:hypothetical protein